MSFFKSSLFLLVLTFTNLANAELIAQQKKRYIAVSSMYQQETSHFTAFDGSESLITDSSILGIVGMGAFFDVFKSYKLNIEVGAGFSQFQITNASSALYSIDVKGTGYGVFSWWHFLVPGSFEYGLSAMWGVQWRPDATYIDGEFKRESSFIDAKFGACLGRQFDNYHARIVVNPNIGSLGWLASLNLQMELN